MVMCIIREPEARPGGVDPSKKGEQLQIGPVKGKYIEQLEAAKQRPHSVGVGYEVMRERGYERI
jgi:hypothetical protein